MPLPLAKTILVVSLYLHLSLAGLLLAAALMLLLIEMLATPDGGGRRLAEPLARRLPLNMGRCGLLLVTLLPVLAAASASYPDRPWTEIRWGLPLLLLTGLLLLAAYRRLPRRGPTPAAAALGMTGLSLCWGTYFLLTCGAQTLLRPHEWPFLADFPLLALSWNGVAVFSQFFLLSFGLLGGACLLLSAGEKEAQAGAALEKTGAVLSLLALLALPPLLLFDLYTLPALGLSPVVFALAASYLAVAGATAWVLLDTLRRRKLRPRLCLAAFMILFGLFVALGQAARENILGPYTSTPNGLHEAFFRPPTAAAAKAESPAVDGGKVFARVCVGCHRFDSRLVGPPLLQVLPKYRGRAEALKSFIRRPQKVDPAYPSMPDLGLQEEEISAVAGYLLEQAAPGGGGRR